MFEEHEIKFPAEDAQLRNEVGRHVQEVADILGVSAVTEFSLAKVGIYVNRDQRTEPESGKKIESQDEIESQ